MPGDFVSLSARGRLHLGVSNRRNSDCAERGVKMSSFPAVALASEPVVNTDSSKSGVSWPAVLAGGFVGAALALVMIALGAGLGLSAVSPWSTLGVSGSALGTAAISWLIVTQAASAGLGGYLAGRLRVRWNSVHSDEVYFRDTAQGLLVWALGVVVTASLLTSAALSFTGSSAPSASTQREGVVSDTNKYFVDKLFRSDRASSPSDMLAVKAEAERILAADIQNGQARTEDQAYLAQLVSSSTGMTIADSKRRVSDTMDEFRGQLEKVRRAAAHSLLWIFVSLLIGAFCASFAATIGGKQRDRITVTKR